MLERPEGKATEPAISAKTSKEEIMAHEKKIYPQYFDEVRAGLKNFELRKRDEGEIYLVGDEIILKEWDPETKEYTGRQTKRTITYVLSHCPEFGLKDGYAILGLNDNTTDILNEIQRIIDNKMEMLKKENEDQGETAVNMAYLMNCGLNMAKGIISVFQPEPDPD